MRSTLNVLTILAAGLLVLGRFLVLLVAEVGLAEGVLLEQVCDGTERRPDQHDSDREHSSG